MKLDMHCHTLDSDGKNTVDELISKAKQDGFDALFVTDHDRIGFDHADKIQKSGLVTLPSVEITTTDSERVRKDIHMTYYSNHYSGDLQDILKRKREDKEEFVREFVVFLLEQGLEIGDEYFYGSYYIAQSIGANEDNIQRLQELGVDTSSEKSRRSGIYKKYINKSGIFHEKFMKLRGREYFKPTLTEIAEITAGEGVLSFAHPNLTFERLGVRGFIEVYREYYHKILGISAVEVNTVASKKWVEAILGISDNTNTQITFGSDCHEIGNYDSRHGDLGSGNRFISEERIGREFGNLREQLGI